ncbi:MAG: hypothetical protein OCD76_10960 [Reichenbachiella sp.]
MKSTHSFHIPVMGIGFTIDTPLKVARFGIDSVMALAGDTLYERLRKFYLEKHNIAYVEITEKAHDYRAKRITAYLNLVDELVAKSIEAYKTSPLQHKGEIEAHIDMLPDGAKAKQEFHDLMANDLDIDEISDWITANLVAGSIDVNIMTKLDKENHIKGEKLPPEHNDAHVAIRGYANSTLNSSVILSAGLNPRLFTYMEQFDDFYPNEQGKIKKGIVLKVSDYRSAIIQGKFLAKKGLWVSEYRIESGLNCGGHAFATEGFLMGPILAEFKENRKELFDLVYEVLKSALDSKERSVIKELLPLKFTAQGGVGTHEEHQFLLDHYQVDSVGWGSPFLLVPEATNVDNPTLTKLIEAKEEDLFLSNISPLGVQFNSLRGDSKDIERQERIAKGRPGSPCVEGNLALFNKEFTDIPICTASRQYQNLKIKELDKEALQPEIYQKRYDKIVDKTCLCTGLVNPVLIVNDLKVKDGRGKGVAICPGPNMAYFTKKMSLKEITNHIYGRENVIAVTNRPHMFIKELRAYVSYLTNLIADSSESVTKKEKNRLMKFSNNLIEGIGYYQALFRDVKDVFSLSKTDILSELETCTETVRELLLNIEKLPVPSPVLSE